MANFLILNWLRNRNTLENKTMWMHNYVSWSLYDIMTFVKLESVGILIELRPFGERDGVARIFTRDHGVLAGVMRASQIAKKNKPLVGQTGAASWNARLDSQLGVFHWEAEKNLAAPLMADADALSFVNSAFALLAALLPEREKYGALWNNTESLLDGLRTVFMRQADIKASDKAAEYAGHYLDWEINLLRELGYALDLSHCSGCGAIANLTHLSPRTAHAVCRECAAPYLDKLFRLPVDLDTTRKFLDRIMSEQGGRELPLARKIINPPPPR